jgi:hypothetical protein
LLKSWRRLSRRLRYRRATRPDRSATADAYAGVEWPAGYFDEFRRAVRVDWKPYVEWWQRPFRVVTLDERGLRSTPGENTEDEVAIRILCFGGSTMMGMGSRDNRTIPAVLARRLGALGHRVAVTNYGFSIGALAGPGRATEYCRGRTRCCAGRHSACDRPRG